MSGEVKVALYAGQLNHEFGIPKYETEGAAGLDIRSNEKIILNPGETKLIPTGLFVAIPQGYELQVRPRSGMSLKTGFRVANAPGTIDSDYRGEICVIGQNTHGSLPMTIAIGERVAQLVLQWVPTLVWHQVEDRLELSSTDRGEGGFGSTGAA